MQFHEEIQDFITGAGFRCTREYAGNIMFLRAASGTGQADRTLFILPAEICARTREEAEAAYMQREKAREILVQEAGPGMTVTLAQDRWRSRGAMYRNRLLAHLGIFRSIFARNCTVCRTDRATAGAFLDKYHNYGSAACRYCYSLCEKSGQDPVAVAAFSNARRWIKGGKTIRSYEWVRYASAEDTRITGGMGKLLAAFIRDLRPDDIMSYADLEWSDGNVYRQLGFETEGLRKPVMFRIDPENWTRKAAAAEDTGEGLWYMNGGSLKYRLKLTCY